MNDQNNPPEETPEETRTAAAELRESAHRIWLAGLGALAAAEEEGSKLFRTLVERGEHVEERGREKVQQARDKAGKAARDVEEKFDEKVEATLRRLGIPRKSEIAELEERIRQLEERLKAQTPPA